MAFPPSGRCGFPMALLVVSQVALCVGEDVDERPASFVEEEEFTERQATQGEVLITLVLCFMGALYFLHYPDKDIRKYANGAMSDTISIFSAVLTFSSINSFLETAVLSGWSPVLVLAMRLLFYFFWYTFMLVVLSIFTGVMGKTAAERKAIVLDPVRMQNRRNGIKLARVFGHITGFAGISFWSNLQGMYLSQSPAVSMLVLPISLVVSLIFVHMAMNLYRSWLMEDKEMDRLERLWEETIWEVENDFVGLIASFLLVKSVRFAIVGSMPNAEGSEGAAAAQRTAVQILHLYIFSLFGFLTCCAVILWRTKSDRVVAKYLKQMRESYFPDASWPFPSTASLLHQPLTNPQEAEEDETDESEELPAQGGKVPSRTSIRAPAFLQAVTRRLTRVQTKALERGITRMSSMSRDIELSFYMRIGDILQNIFVMTFAWSFFYASQWLVLAADGAWAWLVSAAPQAQKDGIGLPTAQFVTLSGAFLIIILDKVHDKTGTSKEVRKVLRRVCEGVGILIGFAWEQCFDEAAGAVGSGNRYPALMRIFLSLFCVGIVVPAWLWHIIPVHEEKGYLFGVVPTKTAAKLRDALRQADDPDKARKVRVKFTKMLRELEALHALVGPGSNTSTPRVSEPRASERSIGGRSSRGGGSEPPADLRTAPPAPPPAAAAAAALPVLARSLAAREDDHPDGYAFQSEESGDARVSRTKSVAFTVADDNIAGSAAASPARPPRLSSRPCLEAAQVEGPAQAPQRQASWAEAQLLRQTQAWEQTAKEVLHLLAQVESGGAVVRTVAEKLEAAAKPACSAFPSPAAGALLSATTASTTPGLDCSFRLGGSPSPPDGTSRLFGLSDTSPAIGFGVSGGSLSCEGVGGRSSMEV